jgi:uncharacterized protein
MLPGLGWHPSYMRIAVSGSHGFIGSALVQRLRRAGHLVSPLVRGTAGPGEIAWDIDRGKVDTKMLAGIDALVHLAGEKIGPLRLNDRRRARVLDSRVRGTTLLAEVITTLDPRPRVVVCASGADFYGDRGDEDLNEESGPGLGFLAEVAAQWEASMKPAAEAGIRVVWTRSGIVLNKKGGSLPLTALPFRLGVGGRLGSGKQWVPWITLHDECEAMLFALENVHLSGPVNCCAPNPVTNAEFTKALARALRRPAIIPAPATVLKLVLGTKLAEELILSSKRLVPAKLKQAGFEWRDPKLEPALENMFGRRATTDSGVGFTG